MMQYIIPGFAIFYVLTVCLLGVGTALDNKRLLFYSKITGTIAIFCYVPFILGLLNII